MTACAMVMLWALDYRIEVPRWIWVMVWIDFASTVTRMIADGLHFLVWALS
jgi:hypothetical protein